MHAHQQQDQSRRDDLWGWFYCLVELVEGGQAPVALPAWRQLSMPVPWGLPCCRGSSPTWCGSAVWPCPAGTLPWRNEREAAPGTTTATYGAGSADSLQLQLQLLPSPPQEGSVVGEGATPQQQQQQLLSKGEVLQRKLECLEQPQLLITSIPCPQVPPLPACLRWPRCSALPARLLPLLPAQNASHLPDNIASHHFINLCALNIFICLLFVIYLSFICHGHVLPCRPSWTSATT